MLAPPDDGGGVAGGGEDEVVGGGGETADLSENRRQPGRARSQHMKSIGQ